MSHLYFVFSVKNVWYAVDSNAVVETFNLPEITTVEEMPDHIVGIINLRGEILPITDLNLIFSHPTEDMQLSDGILVIGVANQRLGIIVNRVIDVMSIDDDQIDKHPTNSDVFINATARVGEHIIYVLDHVKLLKLEPNLAGAPAREAFHVRYEAHDETIKKVFHRRALDLISRVESNSVSKLLQVAVVKLGDEYFGLDIRYVNEFTYVKSITPLPNCPEHIVGNMNLRGSILTVIDIQNSLGMSTSEFDVEAKIVVSSFEGLTVGIMVDLIEEIIAFDECEIAQLPASTHPELIRFALGTLTYRERAMTILNLPEILKNKKLIVN